MKSLIVDGQGQPGLRPAWVRLLVLTLVLSLLGGCGIFGKEFDETEGWSAEELYSRASRELGAGNYTRAIELYRKIEARYPFGRYAMQAQLDLAYAHYRADQPEEALAAADRFIKLYPQNPFVDYAYYLKGVVNYNRSVGFLDRLIPVDASQRDPGSAMDAFEDFAELVRRFPDSRYAEDARQRMLYLRNNLARHEVNVAQYYLRRGAYIAAANRAQYVVERYQRTAAVEDALEVMIAAYQRLGKDQLAADARRVLVMNREAGRFIDDGPPPGEITLGRRVWDYLGFDRN
ncbi:MAG: outer membrane protein assembly factor BamD [Chromatiaceae bacterium]|nr:MAG: outer membrane protein assembly factor BamD [Chromatiaceae bacterium]